MKPVTHYEVYQVKYGRWTLRRRFAAGDQDRALDLGRDLEATLSLPVQIVEEVFDPQTGSVRLKVTNRFGKMSVSSKGPPEDGDVGSRLFMIFINAIGIGLIAAAIAAMLIAPLRDATTRSSYNMLLFFIFAAATLSAALALFKLYMPLELVLWRNKTQELRSRIAVLLVTGTDPGAREAAPPNRAAFKTEPRSTPPAPPEIQADVPQISVMEPPPPAAAAGETTPAPVNAEAAPAVAKETNADQGEQTSFQLAPIAAAETPAAVSEASVIQPLPPEVAALYAAAQAALFAFTDAALGVLAADRPVLQAFERYGFNLYLAGAARGAAAALPTDVAQRLLQEILERAGTSAPTAQAFAARVDASLLRPRFRALADAGAAAFAAPVDENGTPHAHLVDLLREWSDPSARGARAEIVTFLLTDIVGSTALTAQIGNSGAQRVVRAHNTIVRTAAKEFRGREVKHTGDGLLLTFGDPLMAARAAIDIQQEASDYARDNPEAPLALRVGIHSGQAGTEDGEYFGEAVLLIDGVCACAETGEIACSEEIATRLAGAPLKFAEVGMRQLKGTEIERKIFKLDWMPRAKAPEARIEYRQIGGLSQLSPGSIKAASIKDCKAREDFPNKECSGYPLYISSFRPVRGPDETGH